MTCLLCDILNQEILKPPVIVITHSHSGRYQDQEAEITAAYRQIEHSYQFIQQDQGAPTFVVAPISLCRLGEVARMNLCHLGDLQSCALLLFCGFSFFHNEMVPQI